MRENIINDMKVVFGKDLKRINHALSVLKYAEKILAAQGGNQTVVTAAAILHDIGIHQAEQKYSSSAGIYQEIEGPPIAKAILEKYQLDEKTIEHICKIIANHHSAKDIDTPEFRIIWDADWLVNLAEEFPDATKPQLQAIIEKIFKTEKGHRLAIKLFLEKSM
jgi:hypothetical protein